ncbi:hypothetical protein M011DRAFT_494984 [Sporormia fimetaria CBS 119925]|uniref:Uncharacterized protein n=1 Tax=Sporormia fimetaria CBS 119925 TaxID=1340428 RepID=A0A6A6V9W3_9PLEO|nr:hypothetical protein M011DRAFT_494984 [Sporormia fimetaria CBS 119925]
MNSSHTINPQALNSTGTLAASAQQGVASQASQTPQPSRGLKRSRSPDNDYDYGQHGDLDDDSKPRKRGRPPKTIGKPSSGSPTHITQLPPTPAPQTGGAPPVQTPQVQNAPLPQTSPPQASPSKTTPSKRPTIKALPTVRDHTTDVLNDAQDEFIPREIDEAGELKVTPTGHLLGGREYKVRTFFVPHRGEKLFMLATECARTLNYRDSYLLFNKNKSLHKIIATQAEKDDLIHQEILPYSYRSRQIAIVTARSMFRQFGSRLIQNGRRVRDDYWENKARKQGFTEEDAAGEKRPGAAKAREAAAAAEVHQAQVQALGFAQPGPYGAKFEQDFLGGGANPLQPFGGINPAPGAMPADNTEPFNQRSTTDLQPRDYSGVQRPRQELSGLPFQDMSRPTPAGEILSQATQAAEQNRQLNQQRKGRFEFLQDEWARPHEPSPQPQRPGTAGSDHPQVSQAVQSPRIPPPNSVGPSGQYGMASTPQRPGQIMTPQPYRQQPHQQNNIVPTPMASQHTPMRPDQMHRRPPSMAMPPQSLTQGLPSGMHPAGPHGQTPGHGFANSHMWAQAAPQPSPLSQQHNIPQQYAQRPPQQSPLPQPSPMHASPSLHQASNPMHGTPVQQYQTMGSMDASYQAMGQNPYQPSHSPHQYMHTPNSATQPGMAGWPPGAQGQQPGWPQNF